MILTTMQAKIGRKCQLLNSAGAFVDGLVSAADVTSSINDRARELFLKIQNRFPWWYRYNEPIDTVASQSFYPFSDLTEGVVNITGVGIKYSTTDTNYRFAVKRPFKSIFKNSDSEDYLNYTQPCYTEDRDTTDGLGISIYPTPDSAVTGGLNVEYVYMPEPISSGSEEITFIPELLNETLLEYVVADVWEMKKDWSNSNQALNRAILLEQNFFENFDPMSSDTPARFTPNKIFNPYRR